MKPGGFVGEVLGAIRAGVQERNLSKRTSGGVNGESKASGVAGVDVRLSVYKGKNVVEKQRTTKPILKESYGRQGPGPTCNLSRHDNGIYVRDFPNATRKGEQIHSGVDCGVWGFSRRRHRTT